jgi:hypothetical protein
MFQDALNADRGLSAPGPDVAVVEDRRNINGSLDSLLYYFHLLLRYTYLSLI